MREYEIVFIVHPDLDETALTDVTTKVKTWITDVGGEIAKMDVWGKRKLAYKIKNQREGQYILMNVKMEPQYSSQIERSFRLLEPVLRFLITLK